MITNIIKTEYSAFKNDIAPLEMCSEIFVIFSLPIGWLETQRFLIKTNIKANKPANNKISGRVKIAI